MRGAARVGCLRRSALVICALAAAATLAGSPARWRRTPRRRREPWRPQAISRWRSGAADPDAWRRAVAHRHWRSGSGRCESAAGVRQARRVGAGLWQEGRHHPAAGMERRQCRAAGLERACVRPGQGVLAGRGVSGGANVDMAGDKAVLSGHAESQLSHQGSVSAAALGRGRRRTWWTCPPPGRAAWSGRGQGGRGAAFRDEAGGHQLRRRSGPWGGTNSITPDGFTAPLGFNKSAPLASGFSLFYDSNNFSARLRLLQNNMAGCWPSQPWWRWAGRRQLPGWRRTARARGGRPGIGHGRIQALRHRADRHADGAIARAHRAEGRARSQRTGLQQRGIPLVTSADNVTVIPRTRRADTTIELGDGGTS